MSTISLKPHNKAIPIFTDSATEAWKGETTSHSAKPKGGDWLATPENVSRARSCGSQLRHRVGGALTPDRRAGHVGGRVTWAGGRAAAREARAPPSGRGRCWGLLSTRFSRPPRWSREPLPEGPAPDRRFRPANLLPAPAFASGRFCPGTKAPGRKRGL